MNTTTHHILLADDDIDDCIFFKEALEDIPVLSTLTTVNDGSELMNLLFKIDHLPDMLFLDLNMPRKTGFESLSEIKSSKELNRLPVIIFSTSFNPEVVDALYEQGANFYIRKPAEYFRLKETIHRAISLVAAAGPIQPPKNDFVISTS
jgi:CheY-like chemotaxis protein